MNKSIKLILVVAGTMLLVYGIYIFLAPEALVRIGSLDVIKTQNNNNAYLTIGIGLTLLFIGLLGPKRR